MRRYKHNEWISIHDLDGRGGGYTFVHEPRVSGRVAVLPFRASSAGLSYLMRRERVSPWASPPTLDCDLIPCAITGGMDHGGETPRACAAREMREEVGLVVPEADVIDLGPTFTIKCVDTVYHLFAADVTGVDPVFAPSDGTAGERGCRAFWTPRPHLYQDVIATACWARLQHYFEQQGG